MNIDEKVLEEIIRNVIKNQLSEGKNCIKEFDKSGVGVVKADKIKPERFDTGKEGDKVYLKDVFSLEESARLGCGIMEMESSKFEWTLNYDEIDYVIDGTLEIIIDGRKVVGNKGDIILIPKNTKIEFSAPEFARFMYVVYPANWADQ